MRFAGKVLYELGAEVLGILRVLPLVRVPLLLCWVALLALSIVGMIPAVWAAFVQAAVLLLLGGLALFSGTVARKIRAWEWVRYPNGREVAPFCSSLIIFLLFVPVVLATVVLFESLGRHFPQMMPVATWADAVSLTLDTLVNTALFFDVFRIFHVRLAEAPSHFTGETVVFLVRLLMDVVFIKLVIQLLNAAIYRAQGLGRGEDRLFQLHQALDAEDVANVQYLSTGVADSLREAVEALRGHLDAKDETTERAWQGLVAMREFAQPYLQDRMRATAGAEHEELQQLLQRLQGVDASDIAKPPQPGRRWIFLPFAVGLVAGVVLPFYLDPVASLAVAGVMTLLLGWMLITGQAWVSRLVAWGALRASTPDRQVWAVALWSLALLPMLVTMAALGLWRVGTFVPEVFGEPPRAEVTFLPSLAYVLENLFKTQIFADTLEIYDIRIARLETDGWLGGALTLLVRLTLDLGIIALVVSIGTVWFNRLVRGFRVAPNAELSLREQAIICGPQAPLAIGYYYGEIRDFLVADLRQHAGNPQLRAALAHSGFLRYDQQDAEAESDRNPAWLLNRANELLAQGRAADAAGDYRRLIERLLAVPSPDAPTLTVLGLARMNLGVALDALQQYPEAIEELLQARHLFLHLGTHFQLYNAENLAKVDVNLANIYQKTGRFVEAIPHYRRAGKWFLHSFRQRGGDIHNVVVTMLSLGTLLNTTGSVEEAGEAFQQGMELLENHPEKDTRLLLVLADLRWSLGQVRTLKGQKAEATALNRQAVEELEELHRQREDADVMLALSRALGALGEALGNEGCLEEARRHRLREIELLETLVRAGRSDLRGELAKARRNLGLNLLAAGRTDESLEQVQFAVAICRRLVEEGQPQVRKDLASCQITLGRVLGELGQIEPALLEHRQAVALLEQLQAEQVPNVESELVRAQSRLVESLLAVANKQEAQGNPEAALASFGEADEILTRSVQTGQAALVPSLGNIKRSRMILFFQVRQFEQCAAQGPVLVAILREMIDRGDTRLLPLLAGTLGMWADALSFKKPPDVATAVRVYRESAAVYEQLVRAGRRDLRSQAAYAHRAAARGLRELGVLSEAAEEYRQAAVGFEELLREGESQHINDLSMVAFGELKALLPENRSEAESRLAQFLDLLGLVHPQKGILSEAAITNIRDVFEVAQEAGLMPERVAETAAVWG